jgi:hypothetical protein
VNEAPPATAQLGDMDNTDGSGFAGALITNAIGFDNPFVPAPECGLSVLTNAFPALATSDAATVAVIPVMFPALSVRICVGIVCPFHCTTVFATNPPPITLSVKSGLPAVTLSGDKELILAPVGT